jgi:hypothetical protein
MVVTTSNQILFILFIYLFRFNIETGSFGVSIEPKQKENNRNKLKKVLKP